MPLRRHHVIAGACALSPWLWTNLADWGRRGRFLVTFDARHVLFYLAALGASLVFWTALLVATSGRGVARWFFGAVFVALFTLSCGTQAAFFWIFDTYDCAETDVFTRSFFWPLVGSLPPSRPRVWLYFGVSLAVSLVMVRLAVRHVRVRFRLGARLVASTALASLGFVKSSYRPIQASTPDVLYFHAVAVSFQEQLHVTRLAQRQRPQRRHPRAVPAPSREPTPARNVLVILQESQRFDATCTEYDPACPLATPSSNAQVPDRMPFLRWHALDSSTALSCATLWTGLLPSDPLRELEAAPTLFRYAKAAGFSTMYFTSQHVAGFQNMRLQFEDEPIDRFACATTLDRGADWDVGANDGLLTDYVIEHWNELPEPFFAFVHYANQHQPYLEDAKHAPFAYDETAPHDSPANQRVRNENVVYLSDRAVGRLLGAIKRSDAGRRTVILYTSDHGESLGEHGWSGHSVSHYESEIHVPAWLDAPPGTLTDGERAHVRERRLAWLTHADLAPTVLDLFGVWNAPALAPFRTKMIGVPLTRAPEPPRAMPLTNDSWIWESADRSWGTMRGKLKSFDLDGSDRSLCFDLETDPDERHDLGEAGCADLPTLTRSLFPGASAATRPYRPLH